MWKSQFFYFKFVKCALNQSLFAFPCEPARGLAMFWEHIFRTVPQRAGPPVAYILTFAGQKGIKTTGLKVILLGVMLKYHFSTEKNHVLKCGDLENQERRLSEFPWLLWCFTILAAWKLSLYCKNIEHSAHRQQ